jgi:hypothetical protein
MAQASCSGVKRIVGCAASSELTNALAIISIVENLLFHDSHFMDFAADDCVYQATDFLTAPIIAVILGVGPIVAAAICSALAISVNARITATCAD